MSMYSSDYNSVVNNPTRYDTYLVKTRGGTYEFAHFNREGWTIQGGNKGAEVLCWCEIPQTDTW